MERGGIGSDGMPRRGLLVGGVVLAGSAAAGGYYAWTWRRPFQGPTLSAAEAHQRALAGEILLVDIRRPDEWAATGVGEGAAPLDMRRSDFREQLDRLRAAAPGRPLALICAKGVRSSQLSERLAEAGLGAVIDVPEGMEGSGAGPGWVAAGLPVLAPSGTGRP